MAQVVFSNLSDKKYRSCRVVSTGFCGLHYVRYQNPYEFPLPLRCRCQLWKRTMFTTPAPPLAARCLMNFGELAEPLRE